MRSFVAEPMSYGKLCLAGDAAHIVAPTGAKGLNLALADVRVLETAFARYFQEGDRGGLDLDIRKCPDRVWKAQNFSLGMTELLHLHPGDDAFAQRLQRARQEHIVHSEEASRAMTANYVWRPLF